MTTKIDVQKCTGCGECVEICPASPSVYEIGRAKGKNPKASIKYPQHCIDCGACIMACPENAITSGD